LSKKCRKCLFFVFFLSFFDFFYYITYYEFKTRRFFMNKIAIAMVVAFAVAAQAQAWEWTLAGDGGNTYSGGYWFGYDDHEEDGNEGKGGCSTNNFPPGSNDEDIVTPAWRALGGITYTFATGCTYKYRYSGFGFNWFDPQSSIADNEDPVPGATGITICYDLVLNGATCVVELSADGPTKYNNYTASLTAGNNQGGKTFPWAGFGQETGWGTTVTWAEAWTASTGFKFKCMGLGDETGEKSAKLTLSGFGFGGSCQGGTNPTLKPNSTVAGLNLVQNGRMLSLSVERAVSVQVINLQGALAHTQTLTPAERNMNLSNLPTGIYLIRVPALGYSNKVILK
jgi:hypothetical protein